MKLEEQYEDVLQNIEFGIIRVYREHQDMTDWQALDAVQALIRTYQAEAKNQAAPTHRLQPLAQAVYDSAHAMCEWRLGRTQPELSHDEPPYTTTDAEHDASASKKSPPSNWFQNTLDWLKRQKPEPAQPPDVELENVDPEPFTGPEPIPLEVLVTCLKRIRKSIKFWSKQGGRRGYLNYVDGFIL